MVRKAETPRLWVLAFDGRGQVVELVLDREFRVDDALGARLLQERRQVVIVLRADHHVDGGRPAQDLLALGLGDAAGDDDLRLLALRPRAPASARARGRARNRPSRRPSRGYGRC